MQAMTITREAPCIMYGRCANQVCLNNAQVSQVNLMELVACLLKMSGREGCLAILLDRSVKHYDLAQNRLLIDLNDVIVQASID